MSTSLVVQDLAGVSSESDLLARQDAMGERWLSGGADVLSVSAVLEFMEQHPTWDFGRPGALVRFVEKFYRKGYEERLTESISRRPTFHTLWMLNRLINGERDEALKAGYIALLSQASARQDIDDLAKSWAREFLELHAAGG